MMTRVQATKSFFRDIHKSMILSQILRLSWPPRSYSRSKDTQISATPKTLYGILHNQSLRVRGSQQPTKISAYLRSTNPPNIENA